MIDRDENLQAMKARLEELRPMAEEFELLRRAVRGLEDIKLREEDPEEWERRRSTGKKGGAKQSWAALSTRLAQLEEILAKNPEASTAEIAEEMGVTRARVSQLMAELRRR